MDKLLYLGFDVASPPSTSLLQAWNTDSPFFWLGYYLGGCCVTDASWPNTYSVPTLNGLGWGVRALYVDQQIAVTCPSCTPMSSCNAQTLGAAVGQDAVSLAGQVGLPAGATIFLDIEGGDLLPNYFLTYVDAWVTAVRAGNYVPGFYVTYTVQNQLYGIYAGNVLYWVAAIPCPNVQGNTPIQEPNVWQFALGQSLSYGGYSLSVDVDVAPSTGSGGIAP